MSLYTEKDIGGLNLTLTSGSKKFIVKAYSKYFANSPKSEDYGKMVLALVNAPLKIIDTYDLEHSLELNKIKNKEKKHANDRFISFIRSYRERLIGEETAQIYFKQKALEKAMDKMHMSESVKAALEKDARLQVEINRQMDKQLIDFLDRLNKEYAAELTTLTQKLLSFDQAFEQLHAKHVNRFLNNMRNVQLPSGKNISAQVNSPEFQMQVNIWFKQRENRIKKSVQIENNNYRITVLEARFKQVSDNIRATEPNVNLQGVLVLNNIKIEISSLKGETFKLSREIVQHQENEDNARAMLHTICKIKPHSEDARAFDQHLDQHSYDHGVEATEVAQQKENIRHECRDMQGMANITSVPKNDAELIEKVGEIISVEVSPEAQVHLPTLLDTKQSAVSFQYEENKAQNHVKLTDLAEQTVKQDVEVVAKDSVAAESASLNEQNELAIEQDSSEDLDDLFSLSDVSQLPAADKPNKEKSEEQHKSEEVSENRSSRRPR